jgi:hypothetical protein
MGGSKKVLLQRLAECGQAQAQGDSGDGRSLPGIFPVLFSGKTIGDL